MAETCETLDTAVSSSGLAKRHAWQGPGPPKYLLCPATLFKKSRYSNRTVKHFIKAVSKHNLLCK